MLRRDLIRLLACAPACAPLAVPASPARRAAAPGTLVLLELSGGNDGLNTVVPFADPAYYRLRPELALARDDVIALDERLGLNPALAPLLDAWRERDLAIVLGVGYPRPNRSHFRSIEIWDTGSASDEYVQEGWLARTLAADARLRGAVADAVVMGRGNLAPVDGAGVRALVMRDPDRFLRDAGDVAPVAAPAGNPALAHVVRVQNDLRRAVGALERALAGAPAALDGFPATAIGAQLRQAARLIVAGAGVPVLKLSHGSFDTHKRQRAPHDRLLGQLSEALAAFRRALRGAGAWERVLVMTYSEFGRRPAGNGSGGTDHGTAAPHLLLGGRVRGGLHGAQPTLPAARDRDLDHTVDFRRLYATVARRWWGLAPADAAAALGPFAPLDLVT